MCNNQPELFQKLDSSLDKQELTQAKLKIYASES